MVARTRARRLARGRHARGSSLCRPRGSRHASPHQAPSLRRCVCSKLGTILVANTASKSRILMRIKRCMRQVCNLTQRCRPTRHTHTQTHTSFSISTTKQYVSRKELTREYNTERHIIGHSAHASLDACAERQAGGQRGRDVTVEQGERAGSSGGDARPDLASGARAPGLASAGRALAAAMRSIQEKSALERNVHHVCSYHQVLR